jgi:chromosome segregation ATPase
MIERLIKEAEAEASHKAWCDEEMSETKEKKEDLEANIEKYTVKIEKMTSNIAILKEEVKTLQAELAALAKSEAEMDAMRNEQHTEYVRVKKELEEGVEGLQMALKVLRDYYAKKDDGHGKSSGAGGSIIGLLEVAESDFTKNLSDVMNEEDSAQSEYDKIKKENAITRTMKEQDVKYKTKEYKGLEKAVAEAKSDLEGFNAEYAGVTEYWSKLQDQCIAKPEPYAEKKRRREAEIAGLKDALQILEAEAFVQMKAVTHHHFLASKQ